MIVPEKNNFCIFSRTISRFFATVTLLWLLPFAVLAQSIVLRAPKTTYRAGDSFQVSVSVNTVGQAINTMSGKIAVPVSSFELRDTRYGSSILSLWVEKPHMDRAGGFIYFSGGVPGGFSGSAGPVLSFGLKAKRSGVAEVSVADIKMLLNDGLGTEVKNVSAPPLRLTITEALPAPTQKREVPPVTEVPSAEAEVYTPPPDTAPPEEFIPLVSRHPSVADNAYFVSFFAVDKDTGISYYEIREKPQIIKHITTKFNSEPVRSETPYILKGQYWAYDILVRACDQAGNCKEASAEKPLHPMILWVGVAVLVAGAVLITRQYYLPRKSKHRMV